MGDGCGKTKKNIGKVLMESRAIKTDVCKGAN